MALGATTSGTAVGMTAGVNALRIFLLHRLGEHLGKLRLARPVHRARLAHLAIRSRSSWQALDASCISLCARTHSRTLKQLGLSAIELVGVHLVDQRRAALGARRLDVLGVLRVDLVERPG